MTPENKAAFEDNRHHWHTLKNAGYLRSLNANEKAAILKAAKDEFFGEGFNPDMWCGECVMDFIKQTYQRFEQWEAEQPIIVEANFPSNKDL